MKKVIMGLVLSATLLSATAGATVYAAEVDQKNTTGEVGFKTPDSGALTLVSAADLDFGMHAISAADEVYTSETDTVSTVQDIRGTEAGWALQVSENGQFKNGTHELTNAEITLVSPSIDANSTAIAHEKTGVALKTTNEAAVIMDAQTGEGNGLAIEDFAKGTASLSVPGATVKVAGQYTTTLNWVLTDGVANN
ncbi:WxL domain-containing protein [Enterococcus sp. DIV0660C]|uniref:WxL domain-containing protein n=1 Tax=Enterococcus sp. DIV0660C TaxID=2230880 RepID=UPI001A8E6F04|nr:WxL domain-containing protein [Enterococcus sp. DIV0660C]MBO0431695.1 WxL domain-containing protein [Enterococcus sp. DIV0660C]